MIGVLARGRAARQEPECEEILGVGFHPGQVAFRRNRSSPGCTVSGNLGADKFVVRQVLVDGGDDPVAPEVDPRRGGHVFIHVGVPQHVQPVTAIADRVLFTGQQPGDHPFPGLGRGVGQEGVLFLQGGGQSGQVQGDPAQPDPGVGIAQDGESLLATGGGDKGVDRIGG